MGKRGKVFVGLLGILVAVLLIFQTPVLARARGLAWDAWVSTVGRLADVGELRVEPDVLTQLQTLRSENTRLTADLRRFQRLEKQLGSSILEGFQHIPARVAARAADTFASEYVLNRGADDGVISGAPVTVYGSTLIGFVSDLSAHSSVVTLLVSPATALPVEISGDEASDVPVRGLAQGNHFTSVILGTVPRDQKLISGMQVVTVGEEEMVPHGLVIGRVGEILHTEQDVYQSALITLPYDPGALEAVTIITPQGVRP